MQFNVFLICTCVGVLSGFFYDFLYVIRSIVCGVNKNFCSLTDKILTAVFDVFFFIIFGALFVAASAIFEFPNTRFYMIAGCAIGFTLYYKSFHYFIAFLIKKVYNSINQKKEK